MSSIIQILGTSTPVSEILAQEIGFVKAGIACRIFFYQQLKDGVCSASIGTLAKKLGMSTGAVSTNIKWLRENGYIDVVGEHKSGNASNKYVVTQKFFDCLEHSESESEHSESESNFQNPNGKEEIEEEIEEKTTSDGDIDVNFGKICTTYENEIGILSPTIRDEILDYLDIYPAKWIIEAISISAKQNKRRLSYIEGILKRWKSEGKNSNGRNGNQPNVVLPTTANSDGSYNF